MLPRKNRISRESEIKAVLDKRNKQKHYPLFGIVSAENASTDSRILVVTSKKLGNAVVRNKIRRSIYAKFIENMRKIRPGRDFVVFPRKINTKNGAELRALKDGILGALID